MGCHCPGVLMAREGICICADAIKWSARVGLESAKYAFSVLGGDLRIAAHTEFDIAPRDPLRLGRSGLIYSLRGLGVGELRPHASTARSEPPALVTLVDAVER